MMPEPLVARLARYLALKAGAEDPAHFADDAAGILALIKDADDAMVAAGDAGIWRAMIDAALVARWETGTGLGGSAPPPPAGTDEEGEVPFDPRQGLVDDTRSWVQVRQSP
jgi:hypothetical protein